MVKQMSQNAQDNSRVLELVRIKSWYMPGNIQTYNELRTLKVPLLKIHKDFIPTLGLLVKKAELRVRSKPFQDLLDAYLDKIGVQWQSRPKRKCKLGNERLVFTAPLSMKNKEAVQKLDVALARFFERWGHFYNAVYSAEGEKLKLVVDYGFDANRNPVLPSVEPVNQQVFEFVLGFTKLRFTFHDKRSAMSDAKTRMLPPIIQTEVLIQAGTQWTLAHTSTCVDSQIGDPSQFLSSMGLFFERYTRES